MKIVLVTGGSRGIGAAVVKKFAENGYTVIVNYNKSQDKARLLQKRLLASGHDVHLVQADVSCPEEVQAMFAFVKKYFKKIDVLVNNAGVWRGGTIDQVTESDYDFVNEVNAKGTFLCCKYALPLLKKSMSASVVNVSSIWGTKGASCESVYCMSKFAVVGLSLSLAEEWNQIPIAVNCVCPPIVRTDMCACYSDAEVADFCAENKVSEYTAEQVADDVFELATNGANGIVVQEGQLK